MKIKFNEKLFWDDMNIIIDEFCSMNLNDDMETDDIYFYHQIYFPQIFEEMKYEYFEY